MKYNKDIHVIIPMLEYDELLNIKNNIVKAFDEKKMVLHCSSSYISLGLSTNTYSIVNETEIISDLSNRIKDLIEQNRELRQQVWDLEHPPKSKKKWYQF